MIAVTLGDGKAKPQGVTHELASPLGPVFALRELILSCRPLVEGWISMHVYRSGYRSGANWEGSAGIGIDVDYLHKPAMPTPDETAAVVALATTAGLPGNLFHLTPSGFRVFFVFPALCRDRDLVIAAARGAAALVARAIEGRPYKVDETVHADLARFLYLPNSIAKGVERHAELGTMDAGAFNPEGLAVHAPAPPAKPQATARPRLVSTDFQDAVSRWNADHPLDIQRHGDACPVCNHRGCFGRLPNSDRWHCFSSDHPEVGVRGDKGYHGDALDIECYQRGLKHAELLRDDGYLKPKGAPPRSVSVIDQRFVGATDAGDAPPPDPPDVPLPEPPADETMRRPYSNNSYLTALDIVEHDAGGVLSGRKLEYDEMTGTPTLGRVPLTDVDETRVRANVERTFAGGVTAKGEVRGLKIGIQDVHAAMIQVARDNPFHPVREYLHALKWDGIERINAVAEDILGATNSTINQLILRRFFVAAVARAMRPGCKVDTMLILQGAQGIGKSTFFSTLASPWFRDTAIDLHSKDSYLALRGAWIVEWAELESIKRARDLTEVKAFLSSQSDNYRPPYGRNEINSPRGCVIVGTTNDDEFLGDETGARRFWPIECGAVDVTALAAQRDQLWAEAVVAYRNDERWHFTTGEAALLQGMHAQHAVSDAWESTILGWAAARLVPVTVPDALDHLGKPRGNWTKADEMRIAGILKRGGWSRAPKSKERQRHWVKDDPHLGA